MKKNAEREKVGKRRYACGQISTTNRRVINPFVDWSFKYLFGTEESKPNLMGFLNLLLMPDVPIVKINYLNNEVKPVSQDLKGCAFDIICEDEHGDKYLIEMQNAPVDNIKERILFYTCRIIDRMARRGAEWDYKDIKRVYSICLMNFTCEEQPKLRRDVQLCDVDDMTTFSDKLNIIFLQLPCLKAENINECCLYYEYLLYLLQEMKRDMKTIEELKAEVASTQLPQLTKELFYKVLETADIASLSERDRLHYESDLKNYMDTMGCIRYAEKRGKEEGREEGMELGRKEGFEYGMEVGLEDGMELGRKQQQLDIARSMKEGGMPAEMIAKYTGLSGQDIENL